MTKNSKQIAQSGLIAAIYIVLTLLSSALGISSGVIQVRLSEALCILPCFSVAAIPGLAVGCLISNILCGGVIWDVVFGTLATLLGAIGTRLLRKNRYLAGLPPILSNTIIIPLVLSKAYHIETAYPLLVLTVGIGELLSCGVLGQLVYGIVKKRNIIE